jgi:hypothetical protein
MRFDGETVSDLIGLWPEPSLTTFASDIRVPVKNASAMKSRDSINVDYWPDVIAAAEGRGFEGVTYERLALMHAKRPAVASTAEATAP